MNAFFLAYFKDFFVCIDFSFIDRKLTFNPLICLTEDTLHKFILPQYFIINNVFLLYPARIT